jgi:hypothetical protein
MASQSVDFLSDKPYVAPAASSTNQVADMLKACHELKIAMTIMRKHPDVLNEFVCAVKGGANLPAPEPTVEVLKNHEFYRVTLR